MQVPNRFYNGADYRYGFQGQEKDNEIKGDGNSINYTFRMHDPRIGRFFAVDPLAPKYPFYSPYSFSGNKPIQYKELEGLEEGIATSMMVNNWERQDREYEQGKVTKDEYVASRVRSLTAVGMGGIAGAAGALALTKVGAAAITAYSFGDFTNGMEMYNYHTSRGAFGKAEEAKRLNSSAGQELIFEIFAGYALSKLGDLTSEAKKFISLIDDRYDLAKSFYKKAGFTPEKMRGHLTGIDYEKSVFTQTYTKGTKLEQWAYLDEAGNPKLGNYYTLPGVDKNTLAIPLRDRVKVTVELLEDTQFLQSTTKNIDDWNNPGKMLQGGGTQLFKTNVKTELKSIEKI